MVHCCFPCVVASLVKTRSVRNVQLKLHEVQALCMKSREIFLSQPTLLELEAPITICGECKPCVLLLLAVGPPESPVCVVLLHVLPPNG
jgi:hypothetical protein